MFLKLPNALLEMRVPPNAFKVLCVLLSAADKNCAATIRTCVIAKKCNVATGTVCSAIKHLERMDLVHPGHRYKENGTFAANRYRIMLPAGRWFAMNLSDDVLRLPASSFCVYAAMLRFCGRNKQAFPSLSRLVSLLGLCKNTVLRAICCLQTSGLLKKMTKWAGKHNLYLIQDAKKGHLVEQKPGAHARKLEKQSSMYSVTSFWCRVKRSVVHFLKSIPLPTLHATKKE